LEPNVANIQFLNKRYKVKGYTFIDLTSGALFSINDLLSINTGALRSDPSVIIGKFQGNHEIIRALKLIKNNYSDFVKAFQYLFAYNELQRKYTYNDKKISDSEKPFFCELSQKIRNEKLPFLDKNRINEDDPGCYASKVFLEYILNLLYQLNYGNTKIEGYQVVFAGNTDIKPIWEYVYSIMSRRGVLIKNITKKYPDRFYFVFYKEKSNIFIANVLNDLSKGDIKIDENKLKEGILFSKAKELCNDFKLGKTVSEDCIQAMEEYASYEPNAAKYDKLIGLGYHRMPAFNKEQIVKRYTKIAEGYEKMAGLQTGKDRIRNLSRSVENYLYTGNKNKAEQLMLQGQKEDNEMCNTLYAFASNDENKYYECIKISAQNLRKEGDFSAATELENKISNTYLAEQKEYYKTLSPMYREFDRKIQNYTQNIINYLYRDIHSMNLGKYIYDATILFNYFPEEKKNDTLKIQQQFYSLILDNSDNLIETIEMLRSKCLPENYKEYYKKHPYNYNEFCLCAINYFNNKK
jgi:hypothetical protein